jgi:hypothetical protein
MGNEPVILDTHSNRIHQLNRTAAFVWNEMRDGVQPEAIPMRLIREFEVETATAVADSRKVVADLHTLGLLDLEAQST